MVGIPGTKVVSIEGPRLERRQSPEADWNSQIDLNFTNRVAKILKGEFRIAACIAHNDEPATAAHHLVDAEIFEMTAVGEVDILLVLASQAEQFGHERFRRCLGTVVTVGSSARPTRIAEPPT